MAGGAKQQLLQVPIIDLDILILELIAVGDRAYAVLPCADLIVSLFS